ncbi:MAG TPA: DUF1420 family protein [Anaeromyxobacteraceae bacterium]|nr:DUF1420 family protein [Anaeromyxobacteraceae bacterium]
MTDFLTLDRLVLDPPLPAILALLLLLGLGALGEAVARALRAAGALEHAAAFVVAAGLAAAAVHAAAWAGWLSPAPLRVFGLGLAALGLAWAVGRARAALAWGRRSLVEIGRLGRLERAGAAAALAVLVLLLLAALGPPTDADSLDYHLGVPLDWLRAGGARARPDWMNSRLVGIGEAWNLLGLAAGTDAAGAVLQWAGLAACATALASLPESPRDRLLAALFSLAAPVVLFLVPTQKPQMLGVAGTTVALALAVRDPRGPGLRAAGLAAASLAVAIGLKHSFVLTAWPVAGALVLAARRGRSARPALGFLLLAFCVFDLPLLARNLAAWGDPLTPLLERFRARPDPSVVAFAEYLRSYAGDRSLPHLLRLPLEITATWRPGDVTTVLGIGTLAAPFVVRGAGGRTRPLLLAAGGAALAVVLLGQLAGRFFLEPYLWAGAALALSGREGAKRAFTALLAGQAALVAAFAAVGAALLLPGALAPAWRIAVMDRAAAGHAELRWAGEVLPPEARLLLFSRFRALAPRPFLSGEIAERAAGPRGTRALVEAVGERRVDAVLAPAGADPRLDAIEAACAARVLGPRDFPAATRNPFNRGAPYRVKVLLLDPDAGCRAELERLAAEGKPRRGGG